MSVKFGTAKFRKRLSNLLATRSRLGAVATDPSVFLCHASCDKPTVKSIGEKLESLGVRAWIDEWEIGPGDTLFEKIGEGISSTGTFVAVLSKAALESRWCKTELLEALQQRLIDGKNIVPFMIEEVKAPAFISGTHYLSLERGIDRETFRLASKVFGCSERVVSEIVDFFPEMTDRQASQAINFIRQDRRVHFGDDWRALQAVLARRGIARSTEYLIQDKNGDRYKAC
ncbi:toll/interleukin-1 receptor domain-containing protein [Caulobacter sp.]|uniref:toll/interleukin-1 receptor domain-containing protein n=1 Tax=Caulobacter sp. TaxID=78 RepID=UPI001B0B1048|nr:toll/interleukin-1 receptor domain-containing protein [Caulobacter sp.]MBO9545833.1 toll/interleukin-1 receptor domain-containing protein [Caulobacter sp.]